MQTYEEMLKSIRPETSLGYSTIRVYQAPELPSLQVGYSVKSNGEPLGGDGDGDWLKSWIVIGYHDLCGEPILIDSSKEAFPVYTAMHGQERRDAKPIATSLDRFGRALSIVAQLATGRSDPAALQRNPFSEPEKQAALNAIQHENPGMNLEFWKILLG